MNLASRPCRKKVLLKLQVPRGGDIHRTRTVHRSFPLSITFQRYRPWLTSMVLFTTIALSEFSLPASLSRSWFPVSTNAFDRPELGAQVARGATEARFLENSSPERVAEPLLLLPEPLMVVTSD